MWTVLSRCLVIVAEAVGPLAQGDAVGFEGLPKHGPEEELL